MKNSFLYIKNPKLFNEIDSSKNKEIDLKNLKFKSNKKIWWTCKKNHFWEAPVDARTRGRGCPYCSGHKVCLDNCLAIINPELCKEWNYKKNIITPHECLKNEEHFWKSVINDRARYNKGKCPYCSGRRKVEIK